MGSLFNLAPRDPEHPRGLVDRPRILDYLLEQTRDHAVPVVELDLVRGAEPMLSAQSCRLQHATPSRVCEIIVGVASLSILADLADDDS